MGFIFVHLNGRKVRATYRMDNGKPVITSYVVNPYKDDERALGDDEVTEEVADDAVRRASQIQGVEYKPRYTGAFGAEREP